MYDTLGLILALFVLTYGTRWLGLAVFSNISLGSMSQKYFKLVPIAVMVSLIMKQLLSQQNGRVEVSLPVLFGGIVCALSMRVKSNFLLSLCLGIATGLIVRRLL